MNKEEFLDFLSSSEAELEALRKQEKAFSTKLTRELIEFVFRYYPEYVPFRKRCSEKLNELARQCANEVLEALGTVDYYQQNKKAYTPTYIAPTPPTRVDGEKELEELKKDIPEEEHVYLEKIHWEDFEVIRRNKMFYIGLHNKAKEIIVEFYEGNILALKGDHLRLLNNTTYTMAIFPFADEVYSLFPAIE